MEVDSEVWIKGKETKKNANDGSWTIGKVVSKVSMFCAGKDATTSYSWNVLSIPIVQDISLNGVVTITVRDESGHDFMFR